MDQIGPRGIHLKTVSIGLPIFTPKPASSGLSSQTDLVFLRFSLRPTFQSKTLRPKSFPYPERRLSYTDNWIDITNDHSGS